MPKRFTSHPAEILLVEDNEGDIVLTRAALAEGKVHVSLHDVRNGVEALAFLRREAPYTDAPRPDLILLDLNMPKMDGRELLVHLKDDQTLRAIPVVVLTTSEAEQDILRSYQLQASCYVTKPVDFSQFQTIIHDLKRFWFTMARLPDGI